MFSFCLTEKVVSPNKAKYSNSVQSFKKGCLHYQWKLEFVRNTFTLKLVLKKLWRNSHHFCGKFKNGHDKDSGAGRAGESLFKYGLLANLPNLDTQENQLREDKLLQIMPKITKAEKTKHLGNFVLDVFNTFSIELNVNLLPPNYFIILYTIPKILTCTTIWKSNPRANVNQKKKKKKNSS